MEREHPQWSHAFARHVTITEQQLARRAATGELPGGEHGKVPANATRWQSGGAMVVAAHGLSSSGEFQQQKALAENSGTPRFAVTRPLPEVLGPGWRADVYGRTAASGGRQVSQWNAKSAAVGIWQRQDDGAWHPLSCYPEPGALLKAH